MKVPPRLRRFWRFVQRENFDRLLLIVLLLLLVSSVAISIFEPDVSLTDGFWWTIVTMTTVGYGDISPATPAGRMLAAFIMLLGVGVLGMLSASIASFLIERRLKEDRGMSAFTFNQHIILCEWNHRAHTVFTELRADPQTASIPIVLIASIESKPLDDDDLYFVQGDVNDETLKRAGLPTARTVVVLGDDRLDIRARDARVVLATLTIESINPDVYTIVELMDEANVRYCERARADEIIVGSQLSSGLISRAALHHGMSKLISHLFSYGQGDELYKIPVPRTMVGRPFLDVLIEMKRAHQSIVLAVQEERVGPLHSNPPADYLLRDSDYLVLMACDRPQVG
jgi:voltage-gated potassium channel